MKTKRSKYMKSHERRSVPQDRIREGGAPSIQHKKNEWTLSMNWLSHFKQNIFCSSSLMFNTCVYEFEFILLSTVVSLKLYK